MTKQNSKIKTAFVIVLYKTPIEDINRLEKEIMDLGFTNFKIYFIDNTKNNRGYAAGVNEGIRQALNDSPKGGSPSGRNCDLLIITNPDISLRNLKAQELLAAGRQFDIWGLAMRMHGKTYFGGRIDKIHMSGGLIEEKPKERFAKIDFVSGSLMCIKRKVVEKIGLFDEKYFMYYEDVDYCLRARRAGFRVGIDSRSAYEHFESSSGNPEKEYLLSQSGRIFLNKYGNIWQKTYGLLNRFLIKSGMKLKKRFLVDFFSLNFSSFANKLLNFVLFIFLVRYLKPDEYGVYALVWAQVSLFSPIVDLGTTSYGIVYLPTESKEKFKSMFNLRLFVSIIIFFLTFLTGFLMFSRNGRVVQYVFLTSFVIFSNMASGSYLIKNAIEEKLYKSSIVSLIFNTSLIFALSLTLVIFRSLPMIFIFIFIFYNLYTLLNYRLVKERLRELEFRLDLRSWRRLIKKSYVFVLISFFAGLYFKIDVFLLQIMKGESEVGIYSAGYKFFEAFLFIAASYNITRTPVFAKLAKKNYKILLSTMKKDLMFLIILGMSLALILFWSSPFVLPWVLKGNFAASLRVVRIVIFALPLILISSVFLNAIYVINKARIIIFIFLFQAFFNFLLNLFFIPRFSYIASSYLTVLSELVNVVLLSVAFRLISKKNENIA